MVSQVKMVNKAQSETLDRQVPQAALERMVHLGLLVHQDWRDHKDSQGNPVPRVEVDQEDQLEPLDNLANKVL